MTRQVDSKTARIQALEFFGRADTTALEHLTSAADVVDAKAGYALITEGHMYHELYIVESGKAEVTIGDEVVAQIGPGEMIGELGLFDRGDATATVRAVDAMTLLVIPYNRLAQIMDENPMLVREMAGELAARLRATDARLN
ncbi:MAG: Crp/Fnr family transcriptional regulator [Acidimicrobiales bacterium]